MASAESMKSQKYDFVIVGAGTAACLLASRLSKRLPDHRTILLEAGEHIRNDPLVQVPGLGGALLGNPKYDWQYKSAPEPHLNNRRVGHPRGKLVGGSSAINSHSVVFPNHEWQDRIAKQLLPESAWADWSAKGMEECYRRLESPNDKVDGEVNDAIRTSYPREMDLIQKKWIETFEEIGHTTTTGFTTSTSGGVTVRNAVDSSKGERSHAGTAFLEAALKRGNVELRTGATVNRLIFDDSTSSGSLRATGVEYVADGEKHTVSAQEIIVCAGAFESPAILERSGIGPKTILDAAKVRVLKDLPGLGENLQDHLNCGLCIETKEEVPTRDHIQRDWDKEQKAARDEYERNHGGRLAEGAAYSFSFTSLQMLENAEETAELKKLVSDIVSKEKDEGLRQQYEIIQAAVEDPEEATGTTCFIRSQRNRDGETYPDLPAVVDGKYVTTCTMLAHPFSRGTCHITSSDPSQKPEIHFNYLSHPLDSEILARHLIQDERIFQQPAFQQMVKPNGRRLPRSFPHPVIKLEDAKAILPINAATNYHPCGTCSMMREELGGVVDEKLRVYGTSNVRVCDASILPIIPRGNILSAVYAFAEKAAELIIRDASPGKKT